MLIVVIVISFKISVLINTDFDAVEIIIPVNSTFAILQFVAVEIFFQFYVNAC